MAAKLLPFPYDRRGRQLLDAERPSAFEVAVTEEDRFVFLGLDREITRREAQQLYRKLGALLGVER